MNELIIGKIDKKDIIKYIEETINRYGYIMIEKMEGYIIKDYEIIEIIKIKKNREYEIDIKKEKIRIDKKIIKYIEENEIIIDIMTLYNIYIMKGYDEKIIKHEIIQLIDDIYNKYMKSEKYDIKILYIYMILNIEIMNKEKERWKRIEIKYNDEQIKNINRYLYINLKNEIKKMIK